MMACFVAVLSLLFTSQSAFVSFKQKSQANIGIDAIHRQLNEKLNEVESIDEGLDLISTISTIVLSQGLSDLDQLLLSQFYLSVFQILHQKMELSQQQLWLIMQNIMQQNIVINMSLMKLIWLEFYNIYYQLSNTNIRDDFVCKLLSNYMLQPGSNCVPDPEIFHSVLFGIFHHPDIDHKFGLIHFIIQAIMQDTYALHTTPEIKYIQLRALIEEANITGIDLSQQVSLQSFNDVLSALSIYYDEESLVDMLLFITSEVMPKYTIPSYDNNTYHIFMQFADDMPIVDRILKMIHCPNHNHERVDRAIYRLRKIEGFKRGLPQWQRELLHELLQQHPSAFDKLSRENWQLTFRLWKQNCMDAIRKRPTVG